jgi:hypothetical protein
MRIPNPAQSESVSTTQLTRETSYITTRTCCTVSLNEMLEHGVRAPVLLMMKEQEDEQ